MLTRLMVTPVAARRQGSRDGSVVRMSLLTLATCGITVGSGTNSFSFPELKTFY
jgi:hypothetical protein